MLEVLNNNVIDVTKINGPSFKYALAYAYMLGEISDLSLALQLIVENAEKICLGEMEKGREIDIARKKLNSMIYPS